MCVTDFRGSNFYVVLYWAEELAARDKAWEPLARTLSPPPPLCQLFMCVTNCRGSNFYVALYWAEELAARDKAWEPLAKALKDNEETIVKELIECQVKVFPFCKVVNKINSPYFFFLYLFPSVIGNITSSHKRCLPW
jgi:hypothetical protein